MPLSGRQANTDKRSSIEIIMAKPPILGAFQLQEQVANIIIKAIDLYFEKNRLMNNNSCLYTGEVIFDMVLLN